MMMVESNEVPCKPGGHQDPTGSGEAFQNGNFGVKCDYIAAGEGQPRARRGHIPGIFQSRIATSPLLRA
eukprot:845104-Prorocentrum_minimum.AAC.1